MLVKRCLDTIIAVHPINVVFAVDETTMQAAPVSRDKTRGHYPAQRRTGLFFHVLLPNRVTYPDDE